MNANPYSEGLRHGYEDHAKAILEILELDISDAAKLEQIRQACTHLPHRERSGACDHSEYVTDEDAKARCGSCGKLMSEVAS